MTSFMNYINHEASTDMMRSLTLRILLEKRWFVLGWAAAFGVMSTLILMFYPSFSEGGGFDEVAKTLPSSLQGFIGDPSIFATIEGFIALQVFDVRMSLLVIIMTIILALSLSLKLEESGELRTILATPLSRTRFALESIVAAVIIVALLALATTAGVYIGIFAIGAEAPHLLIWQLFGLTWLLSVVAFLIPFGLGIATGKRSLTLAISLFVALGSYMLTTFSKGVEWLKDWDYLSLIHYYDTDALREGTFSSTNVIVYLAIILTIGCISLLLFRQRDIS